MLEYNLMQITPGSGARLCSFIGLFMRDPKAVELIRSAEITHVDVAGETATATLSFGGTFEWRWQDGRWLMNRHH